MPRTPTALAAATALLLAASGCALFERPQEEDLDFEEYEQQLTDTYNESVRLAAELDAAEVRITQECLEEQGFTLHDPVVLEGFTLDAERETFMDQPAYHWFLPSAEDARRRGFWQWTALPAAETVEDGEALTAEWEAFQAAMGWAMITAPHGGDGEEPEFFSLPEEEQRAWYVAYGGEEWAETTHSDGSEADDADDEAHGNPAPGGCLLETLEAVYGELEEGQDQYSVRPPRPDGDWAAMKERYAERTADAEGDLLDCLDERGREGWEFYDGQILVHGHLSSAGEGEFALNSYPEAGEPWPDPPSDVPDGDDVQGWLDFERDLAVDFAECGDETGFRETAEHAWQQAQLRYYLDIEEATFAWQSEMRDLIERAQEVIGS